MAAAQAFLGGGGGGMGGAIFVQQGGSLDVVGGVSERGGAVAGWLPGADSNNAGAGQAFGSGVFLQGSDAVDGGAGALTFSPGAGVSQTFSDVIADQSGSGGTGAEAGAWSLVKSGAGSLVLSGLNTFSGGTVLQAGTLDVEGQVGAVSVSGGTLEGDGVTGTVSSTGGTVAPGNASPGVLGVAGLSLGSASSFAAALDGATAGSGYDQVSATGPVSLGGARLSLSLGFTPTVGESFTLLQITPMAGTVSGTFAGLANGAVSSAAGGQFMINYGLRTVTVTYLGRPPVSPGGCSPGLTRTTTGLSGPPAPAITGQTLQFTATVFPAPDGGSVAFSAGGSTIAGCAAVPVNPENAQAICTTTFTAPGIYQIQAAYSGDRLDGSSISAPLAETVQPSLSPAPPSLSPTPPSLSPTPAAITMTTITPVGVVLTGQRVRYEATVTGSPEGGSIEFRAAGTPIPGCESVALHAGTASCETVFTRPGRIEIQALYSGDPNHAASTTQPLEQTVKPSATLLNQPRLQAGGLNVWIACAARSGGCHIHAQLTSAGQRLAQNTTLIHAGHHQRLHLTLSPHTRHLLSTRHTLPVTLTITLTENNQTSTITHDKLTITSGHPDQRRP